MLNFIEWKKKFGKQYASIQDLVKDLVSGQTLTMFRSGRPLRSPLSSARTSYLILPVSLPHTKIGDQRSSRAV